MNLNKKVLEYYYLKKLFSLKENEETTKEVKNLIEVNQFDTDSKAFFHSFMKAKHPKMLTPYSLEELKEMKTFKVKGYDVGFALKKFRDKGYSEIVAVHNADPDVKGIGPALMESAIRNGGRYLDHFDGFLTSLYNSAGFVEYQRFPYDPQYDPDGSFAKLYGTVDVIYRHHNSVPNPDL